MTVVSLVLLSCTCEDAQCYISTVRQLLQGFRLFVFFVILVTPPIEKKQVTANQYSSDVTLGTQKAEEALRWRGKYSEKKTPFISIFDRH